MCIMYEKSAKRVMALSFNTSRNEIYYVNKQVFVTVFVRSSNLFGEKTSKIQKIWALRLIKNQDNTFWISCVTDYEHCALEKR
jgi:hypothetical protein